VLLADEPTAALDALQGRRVMDLLRTRAKVAGTTVLVVTHDPRVREFADRVIEMEDGKLKRIVRRMRPELAADGQWMVSRTGTVVAETAST
jgi:ABC-type lipoprotein export system ATPase subunit